MTRRSWEKPKYESHVAKCEEEKLSNHGIQLGKKETNGKLSKGVRLLWMTLTPTWLWHYSFNWMGNVMRSKTDEGIPKKLKMRQQWLKDADTYWVTSASALAKLAFLDRPQKELMFHAGFKTSGRPWKSNFIVKFDKKKHTLRKSYKGCDIKIDCSVIRQSSSSLAIYLQVTVSRKGF